MKLLNTTSIVTGIVSGLLSVPFPTHAADLSVKPPPAPIYGPPPDLWTGFYAGATIGGVFGDSTQSYAGNDPTSSAVLKAIHTSLGVPLDYSSSPSGFGGGPVLGYRYHFQGSPLVVGLEGRWIFTDFSGDDPVSGALALSKRNTLNWFADSAASVDSFGTFEAKLGGAWDQWYIGGRGGLAVAMVNTHTAATAAISNTTFSTGFTSDGSDTRLGWTIGADACYAFALHWKACATYSFLDFGSFGSAIPVGSGLNIQRSDTLKINYTGLGVDYTF